MIPEPPLLIIGPMANDPDLAYLPWCATAAKNIIVNRAKFKDLEMVEVIFDAMTFLVSRLTAAEMSHCLATGKYRPPRRNLPASGLSAIGIAPGDNLASASHLPTVNQRLLLLGKWIGESVTASAVAWQPSGRISDFTDFCNSVDQYLAGGPSPANFRTAVA
ncbi:hypothetical protein [Sphingorhabdus sp. YGSMI21]|uniref:hypothetical protein n=1 Tax=Sphingorhabdus sp. YGSMI21 TaxID=2077182 RepID=UPI000C1EB407|nr:hypothetical protein [Sphingorhabdus sp. YGSMI21]ATW04874.1 hypothetical protein CHN51_16045 [Sphingorhabdus sp. YGSMI21]